MSASKLGQRDAGELLVLVWKVLGLIKKTYMALRTGHNKCSYSLNGHPSGPENWPFFNVRTSVRGNVVH